ncbi:MAG: hypothetical protein Q7K21_08020, partial [Elusimicrobiota bacterium]|nr:hypothetical protein [Elusimicrobiota bacterium]
MEKKDIALQQLVDSAKLYEKGHYASALTLAGAAEEIFGKIAKEKVGANQHINQPCPPKKDLIAEIDEMKNRLEHDDVGKKLWADGFSDWVEGYIENECACSFVR